LNGQDSGYLPHGEFEVYDLKTKSPSSIPYVNTNPKIGQVVGFLVTQFDTSNCDAVLISNADQKMYICR